MLLIYDDTDLETMIWSPVLGTPSIQTEFVKRGLDMVVRVEITLFCYRGAQCVTVVETPGCKLGMAVARKGRLTSF